MAMGFLKNSAIGGGSVVDLSIRKMTGKWDVYISDEPTPGKSNLPHNPHEVDHNGIGNMNFNLEGHFVEGSVANQLGS